MFEYLTQRAKRAKMGSPMYDHGIDPARVGSTYVVIKRPSRQVWVGPFGYTHDAAQWAAEHLGGSPYEVHSDEMATLMDPDEFLLLESASIPA